MNICDYLIALRDSSRIAVVDPPHMVSYQELFTSVLPKVEQIRKMVGNRKNIALFLPNSLAYIEWYYAILLSDNIVVPIHHDATIYEVSDLLVFCDIALLIADIIHVKEISQRNTIYCICSDTSEAIMPHKNIQLISSNSPHQTALLLGTSGSTNTSKRTILTHRNLVVNAQDIIQSLCYSENEVFLLLSPLAFSATNTAQLLVSLLLSATVVIFRGVCLPRMIMNYIRQYKITSLSTVPSLLRLLLPELQQVVNEKDFPLQTLCVSGEPPAHSLLKEMAELRLPINAVHAYGQTEAAPRISHLHRKDFFDKMGSVGQPIGRTQVKISDDCGLELPVGQEGEIIVKGDNIFNGYYGRPELTAQTKKDGWLFTGDIGKKDLDGYLYITGRKKNVMIISGMNVYPEEIEDVLHQSNMIEDVVAYSTLNEHSEELPIADVVVRDKSVTPQKLLAFCRERLPAYKVPCFIHIVDKVERNKNLKIIRREKR